MENAPTGLAQKRLAAASALSRTRAGQLCRRLKKLLSPRGRHRTVDATERVSISPGLPFWPGGGPEQVHDAGQPLELLPAA